MISIPGSNEWHWDVNGQEMHLLFCKIIIQPNHYLLDSFWLTEKGQIEAENCLSDLNSSCRDQKQGLSFSGNGKKPFYFDVVEASLHAFVFTFCFCSLATNYNSVRAKGELLYF